MCRKESSSTKSVLGREAFMTKALHAVYGASVPWLMITLGLALLIVLMLAVSQPVLAQSGMSSYNC